MYRVLLTLLFGWVAGSAQTYSTRGGDLSLDRIQAAARTYLRDAGEFPMTATVAVEVMDPVGRPKERSEGSVRFVFHGYNARAATGVFTRYLGKREKKAIKESAMTGGDAVLLVGPKLRKAADGTVTIEQPAQAGQPLLVGIREHGCPDFGRSEGRRDIRNFCGRSEYRRIPDGTDGLRIQHFNLDSTNLPAKADTAALGIVQVLTYHVDEDLEDVLLPSDPKPFLVPMRNITTIGTNKGKIVVTNQYAPDTPDRRAGH
jgi:hypothetical protein